MKTGLQLKGFERLGRVLNPRRVNRALAKNVKNANQLLGTWMVDEIRRGIREKRYVSNSPLTKILKNSDMPLVDHGDLLGSAAYDHKGPWAFEVGVVKKSGKGANVAMILHEGATISVTDQMRAYFRWLAHHTKGQVKPLSSRTTTIVIRPSPYLRDAVFSRRALLKVQEEWMKAIKLSFEGVK